jgi:hypothetical protein
MGAEELASFETLLRENKLEILALQATEMTAELCQVLCRQFRSMKKLEILNLRSLRIPNDEAFGRVLEAARNLSIKDFILYDTRLSDPNLFQLCTSLESWKSLRNLRLYHVSFNSDAGFEPPSETGSVARTLLSCGRRDTSQDVHPDKPRQHYLLRALSRCKGIEVLSLVELQITDDLLPDVCQLIEELKKLKDLNLEENCLGSTGLLDFADFLLERKLVLGSLRVANQSNPLGEDAIRRLQDCCNNFQS